jgi:hypothetical protein
MPARRMMTASDGAGISELNRLHRLNKCRLRIEHEPSASDLYRREPNAGSVRKTRKPTTTPGGMAPTTAQTAGSFPDASDDNAINAKTPMPDPIPILSRRVPIALTIHQMQVLMNRVQLGMVTSR